MSESYKAVPRFKVGDLIRTRPGASVMLFEFSYDNTHPFTTTKVELALIVKVEDHKIDIFEDSDEVVVLIKDKRFFCRMENMEVVDV